jgi:acyl-CoA reductase-like NAD-dependent aldehyde dehydrogenase
MRTMMKDRVDHSAKAVAPFIDGERIDSLSSAAFDVINPSNGRRLMAIPAGCEEDVNVAVASARRAFESGRWSEAPPSFRKKTLHRFADLVLEEASHLDALDAEEMGKPISVAAFNSASAASLLRFNAEAIDKVMGDAYASDARSLALQRRVPRGVVAAVVPWNFPAFNAVLKLAPALAAGNCVVAKPSEHSSRSALRLAELAMQAGVPKGVLNVVPGGGETVGRALGLHCDVDMVAFTGSTDVGKMMLQYAGQSNMKVVQAETGGKSPHIVFPDGVDLDQVSASIARSLLTNQGQVCSVGSRLLVHHSIADVVTDNIAAHMKKIVMGDALDPRTTFGPLVSARQCARVLDFIEQAQVDGAQLLYGGRRALQDSGGFFVEPTILGNVKPTARAAQEEIFGPVLCVIPFATEAEAISIANGTVYGLAAYVWTASLSTGMRMAKAVRSMVLVNATVPKGEGPGHSASWDPTGLSGVGTEGGLAGMESYMRRQLVWFNHE